MLDYGEAACEWPGSLCAMRMNNDASAVGQRWACSPLLHRMIKCYILCILGVAFLLWLCVRTRASDVATMAWIVMYLILVIFLINGCMVCYLPAGKMLVAMEHAYWYVERNSPVPHQRAGVVVGSVSVNMSPAPAAVVTRSDNNNTSSVASPETKSTV